MTRSAVVFDFGNVLITWNMRFLYENVIDDDEALDEFLSTVWTSEMNDQCDRGRPIAEVIAELSDRHPRWADQIAEFAPDRRWIETIGPEVAGSAELVGDLAEAGYRLLGLSNFSAETFPLVHTRYPVFDHFEDIVLSGQVGVAKPDPEIFELLCERNGIEPADAVFLDDAPTNTAAARELGFAAITFTDAGTARRELELYDIRV